MINQWKQISGVLAAMLIGSLVTGVVMTTPDVMRQDPVAETLNAPNAAANLANRSRAPLPAQDLQAAVGLSQAFRNVAEYARPSVVSINTTVKRSVRPRVLPRGLPPGLGDMFDRQEERQASGMGSGVIISTDGYILTNNHVVEDADELEVELSDGSTVDGKIIGTDPQTDVAVIKIDRQGLEPIPFGNPDTVQVGDWCVAIGSPFGLDQTVTAGIISGKNRVRGIVGNGDGFEDFLQTDAAINPGNSGGPLVNLRGELIGINTAIMSRTGSSAGIGFAIPVSLARPVFESIVESGSVRRGFLGAELGPVNEDTISELDLKVPRGVVIRSVLDNKPADRAGIRPGDVVTEVDGREVKRLDLLRNYIASRLPGSKVVMKIDRRGRSMQVTVNLQERTGDALAEFGTGSFGGAELTPATPQTAKRYGYNNLSSGLIITELKDDSEFDQSGLEVGDVIESAAGEPLRSADQLKAILAECERQKISCRLVLRRGNQRMLLVIN